MRKNIINVIAFVSVSFILGTLEVRISNWEFWAVMASLVTIQVNSFID